MNIRLIVGIIGVIISLWYLFNYAIPHMMQAMEQDEKYLAHGCYISDGGSMYTCPNGLPPGES